MRSSRASSWWARAPVAAGDTVRWIIGDTESGTGAAKQVHILVKPTRAKLQTNLVINTNLRTYHLELRSTEKTYMASVSWQYPADQLIAPRRQNTRQPKRRPWRAASICRASTSATGSKATAPPGSRCAPSTTASRSISNSPPAFAQGEMPPLFVISPSGNSELVNYRARENYYVVDRLFSAAELRLGDKDSQRRVRIVRTDGRRVANRTAPFSSERCR
nr:TrbG/VirB9 family P-type conjugative transfer protein [Sinorhizobium fredii]